MRPCVSPLRCDEGRSRHHVRNRRNVARGLVDLATRAPFPVEAKDLPNLVFKYGTTKLHLVNNGLTKGVLFLTAGTQTMDVNVAFRDDTSTFTIAGMALLPLICGWPLMFGPAHIVFLELIIDPACSVVFEAEQIDPKIIIPMHYKVSGLTVKLDSPETFFKEVGIKPEEVDTYRINAKSLPTEETKLITFKL